MRKNREKFLVYVYLQQMLYNCTRKSKRASQLEAENEEVELRLEERRQRRRQNRRQREGEGGGGGSRASLRSGGGHFQDPALALAISELQVQNKPCSKKRKQKT